MRRTFFLTALAAIALLATPAFAATSVTVRPAVTGGPGAALASAKLKACASAPYFDARRLEFSGRMMVRSAVSEKLEMRFDVYRKYREQKHYKRLRATGLGEWLASGDPKASIYVREIALAQVETAAKYKARVTFRWTGTDGKVIARTVRTTRACNQRTGLPKLGKVVVKHQPIPGSDNRHYTVSIANTGASEAIDVPVTLVAAGSGSALVGNIESIGPGQTAEVGFDAPACSGQVGVVVDAKRSIRMRSKARPMLLLPC